MNGVMQVNSVGDVERVYDESNRDVLVCAPRRDILHAQRGRHR